MKTLISDISNRHKEFEAFSQKQKMHAYEPSFVYVLTNFCNYSYAPIPFVKNWFIGIFDWIFKKFQFSLQATYIQGLVYCLLLDDFQQVSKKQQEEFEAKLVFPKLIMILAYHKVYFTDNNNIKFSTFTKSPQYNG